ncbi:ABC transporter permease [Actinoplanes sp. NPDC049265]|uniref:ABC transporter permease n=1 Tax=Actinoplanes sp. NPDC049265 TaxID=3363902 RepID=UPI003715FCBC
MSTATETQPRPATVAPSPAITRPVTGRRVMRSEWAKLWSLRSTWITLGLGLLFLVGFGVIAAMRYRSNLDSGQPMDPDFADASAYGLALFGVPFSLITLGVLGVLSASGEYSSGMIRSTLAAVPRRLPVLWSKAAVYGLLAFVVGAAGALVGFLISSAVLSGTPVATSLSDHGVLRGLAGLGVYLGLVGVIGVALGLLLRSTAGGISALVGTFMLVPGLMSLLPKSWRTDVTPYLPSNAGESIYALQHGAGTLSAGAGLLVLLGWTVLALGGAAYRLMRSDA